jgi:6-phosphofructokinase
MQFLLGIAAMMGRQSGKITAAAGLIGGQGIPDISRGWGL